MKPTITVELVPYQSVQGYFVDRVCAETSDVVFSLLGHCGKYLLESISYHLLSHWVSDLVVVS